MCPIAPEDEDSEARMDKDSGWATNHQEQAAAEHREAEHAATRLQFRARQKQALTGKFVQALEEPDAQEVIIRDPLWQVRVQVRFFGILCRVH
jgi:hypothetical protein